MTTTTYPTNLEVAQQIVNLLKGLEPEFIRSTYESRKTAKRHAEKLDAAILAFIPEIITNMGMEEFITAHPHESNSWIIAMPGSAPAGFEVRGSAVDTLYVPRPSNRYAYRPDPTYEIRRYIYLVHPDTLVTKEEDRKNREIRKAIYEEGRQLAQIIPGISTYHYQDLTEEDRQEVKDLVTRYQALKEELANITTKAIRISRNGHDY